MALQPPSSTTQAGSDLPQLDDLALSARRLVKLMNGLCPETIIALDAVGWHTGHTFSLVAELAQAAKCAEKAKRRGGVLPG